MSVQGKTQKTYSKEAVRSQIGQSAGFKNISFAHVFAVAGEDFIPFGSLVTPPEWLESGLVNPNGTFLLESNLAAFAQNFNVTSSERGAIQKSSYIVQPSGIVFKNFVSIAGEIFEVSVSDVIITQYTIVDSKSLRLEVDLEPAETDVLLGFAVDVFREEVIVFRGGLQMFRADENDSSGTTGNYYYLNENDGLSNVIRFFEPAIEVEPILVVGAGPIADSPHASTFQEIQKLAGQIDVMIPTLATLAGVPESDFQVSPNNVDLKVFASLVVELKKSFNLLLAKLDADAGVNDTDYESTLEVE